MSKPTGVFKFMVPVYVTVREGRVSEVHVVDETSFDVGDCELIEGEDLEAVVEAANDGHDWPAWEFGW